MTKEIPVKHIQEIKIPVSPAPQIETKDKPMPKPIDEPTPDLTDDEPLTQ